jgi:hypothetical protein
MEADAPKRALTSAQWWGIAGCAAVLLWSVPGLFLNPDFGIGTDASSELFLGVDINGWHAVSGYLIVIPVLAVLRNEELFPWVMGAAATALYATALWTLLDDRPAAGLFYFPHPTGDVVLHIITGTIFLTGAIVGYRQSPQATAAG